MLDGEKIQGFVSMLGENRLYHACQLRDLQTYITLRGIPSRDVLENSKAYFTKFDTDTADKLNGIWDKVFLNLHDFGYTFASSESGASLPTAYGPISLQFRSKTLAEAQDICISLRSAGGKGFNRIEECVPDNQIEYLFEKNRIRYGTEIDQLLTERGFLREEKAKNPEINITVQGGILSFDDLDRVIVDPYIFDDGETLKAKVSKLFSDAEFKDIKVYERFCKSDKRKEMYSSLLEIAKGPKPFPTLNSLQSDPNLGKWAKTVENLEYQYIRFLSYLRIGTLGIED